MNETSNTDKPTGAQTPKSTLHLKRPVEQGTVRQSFSHGRSKSVVVEKVKRRILGPGETTPAASAPAAPSAKPTISIAPRGPTTPAPARPTAPPPPKTGVVLPTLTAEQREARARALLDARAREEEDRRRQEADAEARREREARERHEREAAEARKREEELRRAQEANFKRQSEEEARRRLAGGEPAPSPSIPRKPPTGVAPNPVLKTGEDEPRVVRRPALGPVIPQKVLVPTPRPARGAEQRNRGRLTVANATSIEEERTRSVASFRRRTQRLKGLGAQDHKEKIAREIVLPEAITIQELASRMSERAVDVIKLLMRQGRMVTLTDMLDADTAELVAEEMGHTVKRVAESDVEEGLFDRPDEEGAPFRVRRSSPLWAMSIMARHLCWTPSGTQTSWRARPGVSPSTSAPIRLSLRAGRRSPSSTHPATPPSPRCAPAAQKLRTSSSSSSLRTMGSCRRRSKRSATPRLPKPRLSSPSTRSTSQSPIPSVSCRSSCNTTCRSKRSAATRWRSKSQPPSKSTWISFLKRSPCRRSFSISLPIRSVARKGRSSKPASIAAADRWRPFLFSAEPCASASWSSRDPTGAARGRSSTTRGRRSKWRVHRRPSRFWVSTARRRLGTAWPSSKAKRARAKSPNTANARGAIRRPRGDRRCAPRSPT